MSIHWKILQVHWTFSLNCKPKSQNSTLCLSKLASQDKSLLTVDNSINEEAGSSLQHLFYIYITTIKSNHNKLVIKKVIKYSISHKGRVNKRVTKSNLQKNLIMSKTNVANTLIRAYTLLRVCLSRNRAIISKNLCILCLYLLKFQISNHCLNAQE